MALTLLTAIAASDTVFDVLGSDDLETGDFKTIDSETIVIRRAQPSTLAYGQSARQRLSVYRGSGGTRAAAHAANASLATYSGGGSGGVTVDNGSDPPAAVTTLVAPGANLSTPGEATLIYLQVRAFDVDTDTPNLINPGDGAGAVAFAVPAGSYGYAFPLVTALWNQAATLEISLGTSPSVHGRIGDWDLTASNAETYAAIEAVTVSPVGQNFLGRWFKAIEDCEIYVAVYPDAGDPTAGSATITAIIATPAS